MKNYIIAIDLHGTLLNEHWIFSDEFIDDYLEKFDYLSNQADFYLCTGNDLQFINQYVPEIVRNTFNGYILETGCVFSNGYKEQILTDQTTIDLIKQLESIIRNRKFEFIQTIAHRLSTISLFTTTETGGLNPALFVNKIEDFVKSTPYYSEVYITYSNVAIDIIPKNYSKFTGIKHISEDKIIISLLDSMNDLDLARFSDLSFLPSNASDSLLKSIQYKKLDQNIVCQSGIYLCSKSYTEGVLEALEKLVKQKGIL